MAIARDIGESAMLFCGLLYCDVGVCDVAIEALTGAFGRVTLQSEAFQWDYYRHYVSELGHPICRRFIVVEGLFDTGAIADVKRRTNELEYDLSTSGRRRVNIDPGYITLAKVVLASTKNYAHRVYLRDGIYAEVTLLYNTKGIYIPHLFTYPDYKEPATLKFLLQARKTLKKLETLKQSR
ncbi:GTP-binding protein [Candidatus Magnetobacterium bavaricum]|uniref:GTP-binding protein n=1 Tax=Candidatus Magnetobacterium bavaricum TaxID=29290 RepID=A0A0F3GK74_9BACT|nr:GTP-binding protein [Candidatus Magnetobacterium bavaricum]